MKTLIVAIGLFSAFSAVAGQPFEVEFDGAGQFDADRVYSGIFTATGAINTQGTVIDSPAFTGAAIHLTRTMVTSDGESIVLKVNANHVSGAHVIPAWCPPPSSIPPETFLFPQSGNWEVVAGSGKYSQFQGTGSWVTWVVLAAIGQPVAAYDCMVGTVHTL